MKQSTISFGFILFSIVVLFTEVTSTISYGARVKQCAYDSSLGYDMDNGPTMTCQFHKVFSKSALRVTYHGDLRLLSSSSSDVCRRWYITFNGQECSSPQPIDAIIYLNDFSYLNYHRPGTLDGICNNIPAGPITVGVNTGMCEGYPDIGDAWTCWMSICRLIIEEIPLVQ